MAAGAFSSFPGDDSIFAYLYPLVISWELSLMNYQYLYLLRNGNTDFLKIAPEGGVTIRSRSLKLLVKSTNDDASGVRYSVMQFLLDIDTLGPCAVAYRNQPAPYSILDTYYSEGEELPPLFNIFIDTESCGYTSVLITVRDLPVLPKSSDCIPEYLKKIILDMNYRIRKLEQVVKNIYKSLHSSSIYDYLKSFLIGSNLYSSAEQNEIATIESQNFFPAVISTADAGLDSIDLLVDIIDYISNQFDDEENRSTLKRIEKRENEVKELLTDEEKLNQLLGDALNVGKSIAGEVVPYSSGLGGYDFTRLIDISKNQDGSFWLSQQVKNILDNNFLIEDSERF